MSDNKKARNEKKLARVLVYSIVLTFVLAGTLAPRLTAGPGYGPDPTPQVNVKSIDVPKMPVITPTFSPPVVVPTDVESSLSSFPGNYPILNSALGGTVALNGIQQIPDNKFIQESSLTGNPTGILVKEKLGSDKVMENDFIVKLKKGEVLVSVKRPSKVALVKVPFGAISINSDGDVLVKFENGVLRVINLDASGDGLKCQLNQGPFGGPADPTVVVQPGFEMVAGDKKLTRADMRPRDGMARRHFKVLENGHLAISEISIESVMKANDVIVDLRQASTGVKERRIIGDMSKMAAILNYKNGTQGFSVSE
ncbi:MAG: hypothetical protein K2X93_02565 [Candidatus Obscuribacterales bacterium]|nr:hypothetical protein [Candidatus Obscuribacterales bacterium]